MTERPGDDDAGYPPAPAPRAEPYTVDEKPADDDVTTAPEPAPLAWSSPGDRDVVARHDAASSEATDARWRPGARAPEAPDASWQPRPATAGATWQPLPGTPGTGVAPQAEASPPGAPDGPQDGGSGARDQRPFPPAQEQRPYPSAPQHGTHRPGEQPYASARGYPRSAPPSTPTSPAPSPAAAPWARHDGGAHAWQSVDGSDRHHAGTPGAAPEASRRRRRRTVGLGVVVLLVLVALLGGIVLGALGARQLFPEQASSLPGPSGQAPVDRAPDSVAAIAGAALESTVFIEVTGGGVGSSGSGMVLREDGYVVTNNHVIAPAADGDGRVTVTFADGGQERAQIVGRTSDYDIAVLRVDRDGLTPLPLADSDAVVVGDTAIAVGAPLGLEGTVTTGIISALNRPVQAGAGGGASSSFINAIQTDAAINPGNSGGPLINGAGEVIGINTAIAQAAGQQTGSIGLGFAIPSNQVRRTAEQIIETGQATYPVIGVALDTRYQGEGVRVIDNGSADTPAITPDGPADSAGIEPGTVITRFDGQPVTTPQELIVAVRSRAPGDTVVLTVRGDGEEEREVEVVLDEAVSE